MCSCGAPVSEQDIGSKKLHGSYDFGTDDPEAPITLSEFRSLAWMAANETARELGWIKSYDELHKAAKRAAG